MFTVARIAGTMHPSPLKRASSPTSRWAWFARRVLLVAVLFALTMTPVFLEPVPELPFESVPNPLSLPDDIHFREIAGVAINSVGHVFVF